MTDIYETEPNGDGTYVIVKEVAAKEKDDDDDGDGDGGCCGCVIGCLLIILIILALLVGIKFFWGLLWTI